METPMSDALRRLLVASVCCALLVLTNLVAVSAYAQNSPPDRVELDITVAFEYPTEIQPGDVFPVYAWINNNSDQSIFAPLQQSIIVRSHLGTYYVSDTCRMHCIFARSRVIPPGGKMLMHMGDVDTSRRALNPGEFSFSDRFMVGYTVDQKLYSIDIEDTIPATIDPAPFTMEPPLPARQALELAEDGRVVRDPNTGYEWLRFSHSVGISEQELQSRLQANGDLNLFSVATHHQVQELLLNHMIAAGVSLKPVTTSGLVLGTIARAAFKQLVELMQATGETTDKIFVSGVVNDPVPLMDGERQFLMIDIYGEKTPDSFYFSSPHGLQTSVSDETALIDASATTGVWLVRGAAANRHHSKGTASYADDYLFLPNVLIDGNNYRLEMYRKEGTVPSFVVTDIRAAYESDLAKPVAEFDAATGLLHVKRVEVMSDLPAGEYDLSLQLVHGTDLPLVRLTGVALGSEQH
jgi:hypothetical protein